MRALHVARPSHPFPFLPLLAGGAALLASACSGETVARPPPPPVDWQSFSHAAPDAASVTPTAKESTVAEDYLTALGSPAFAPLGALFADDVRFSFPGLEDAHERDGAVSRTVALFGAFDQRAFAASRIWRTGSEQTIEWTMSGRQAKDWMSVPATQKPVSIKGISLLFTNDDGTLADAHVYFDVAAVKALLGAGPKELAGLAPPPPATPPAQTIDQQPDGIDHVAVVRTALDAFENGAEATYLAQMTDDVEVHTLEHVDPARGKESQSAYFKAMHRAIAQLDTTVMNGWSVGSFAIVEYTIAGEQVAPIGWVPLQNDRVIKEHIVDVDEIRDGKIARTWRYDNPSELLAPGP